MAINSAVEGEKPVLMSTCFSKLGAKMLFPDLQLKPTTYSYLVRSCQKLFSGLAVLVAPIRPHPQRQQPAEVTIVIYNLIKQKYRTSPISVLFMST